MFLRRLFALFWVLAAAGCVSAVSEAGHPCPCSTGWSCCNEVCVAGSSCPGSSSGSGTACVLPGLSGCATDSDCCGPLEACLGGSCCHAVSSECESASDCPGGHECQCGICYLALGSPCSPSANYGSDNDDELCEEGLLCQADAGASGGSCCRLPQYGCSSTSDCCAGSTCASGACSCVAGGSPCATNGDCCSGICGADGLCGGGLGGASSSSGGTGSSSGGGSSSSSSSGAPPVSVVVTTLAGNGTPGFADGPAGSAELDGPEALVVDGAGDVYFTDQANNRIREVDARGMVSTLAGNGDAGYVDGPGGSAEFDAPDGIALNAMEKLFIGDFDDSCIREVDPSGDVTTYSGNGMAGFANGPVASAEFNRPEGVAIDRLGNLYVADDHNFRIREIGTDGVVTTLAGNGTKGYVDGPAASAEFGNSNGLAVDSNFNVYVTDSTNNRIRMIDTATGLVSTLAGNGQSGSVDGPGGPNGSAELDYPLGVAVDSNFNVYVADAVNNRIRRIDPNGNVTTLAGNGVAGFQDGSGGEAGTAEPDYPTGVALDGLGNLYVTDSKNNRIRLIVTSPPYGAGIPPG